jgi:glyoxylase-like metal-dependent hydrolase (beta-lactamase superfamily II)
MAASKQMFDSLHKKLKVLPDQTEVYPGHDYGDQPTSTGENRVIGLLDALNPLEVAFMNLL